MVLMMWKWRREVFLFVSWELNIIRIRGLTIIAHNWTKKGQSYLSKFVMWNLCSSYFDFFNFDKIYFFSFDFVSLLFFFFAFYFLGQNKVTMLCLSFLSTSFSTINFLWSEVLLSLGFAWGTCQSCADCSSYVQQWFLLNFFETCHIFYFNCFFFVSNNVV